MADKLLNVGDLLDLLAASAKRDPRILEFPIVYNARGVEMAPVCGGMILPDEGGQAHLALAPISLVDVGGF